AAPPRAHQGRRRLNVRGKQVSPPAPFRKVSLRSRLEVTTHTAGVNPASLVTLAFFSSSAGETGSPPSPLPQSVVAESLGSNNSYGRSESGLSRDAGLL